MSSAKVYIATYGCKVNTYDTGLLQQQLQAQGFHICHTEAESDVVVLNTCAVTAEATKEAVRKVRRLKKDKSQAMVVVTGCAAQVDTEQFAQDPDLIVANSHKAEIGQIIQKHLMNRGEQKENSTPSEDLPVPTVPTTTPIFKSNIFKKEDFGAGGGQEQQHTRSFLKIQDGCNSFCTFCVIPFARGKSQSLSITELVRRVNDLHQSGVQEVVLTGVHIGDYCDESGGSTKGLADLGQAILKHTQIPRLRLSSLEPIELTDEILDLYSDERFCPHFHMSIQSACDETLKWMKRNYTADQVEESLNRIAQKLPHAFVGMDVIAGFPSETPEHFEETYNRLAHSPWTKIHVFPYSPRPKTWANTMERQNSREEILQRAKRLRELSDDRFNQRALQQMGRTQKALVLKNPLKAISREYWPIILSQPAPTGEEVTLKITGHQRDISSQKISHLMGEVLSSGL